VKRRSPSKGWIQQSLDSAEQARAYRDGGAAAISVLTEPAHFAGTGDDLIAVRKSVGLPTLKKDFHVAPVQLIEAKALGASAVLLIARALDDATLATLVGVARELALEVVVEVRDARELDRALERGATIVGVNNRDLETLLIDASNSERLLPHIPPRVVAVAESGITGRGDVERLAEAGADAVLVGSSISAAANPVEAVAALTGIRRRARVG
jgi:indole-3-glycerol phosphate synthase